MRLTMRREKSAYTLEQWQNVLSASPSSSSSASTLYNTLYVGESPYGLYAMNTLVDQHTITYSPKLLGPPLLEGPSPIALTPDERKKYVPPKRPIVSAENIPSITHKTLEGEFLVLGYHEPPPMAVSPIFPARFPSFQFPTQSITWKQNDNDNPKQLPAIGGPSAHSDQEPSLSAMIYHIYLLYPIQFYSVVVTLILLLATTIWMCGRQSAAASLVQQPPSAQTSRHSSGSRTWAFTRTDLVPEGWMNVGKLQYNPSEVLGRGCEGTVVYRGKFDGREVAVKRVVSEFVRFVDREADLLRESDAHPHVIRYFCMEADSQFRYLALELCIATLNDYVEEERVREKVQISKVELLRQATEGLAHLHSIQIVHRDMKPQNVLISAANQKGVVRAVISDFGLCKRIQPGRHSLSRGIASGLAGTDGWIAPEAHVSESTSYPVDIFSMGCIFYFVLTDGKHPFGPPISRQANIIAGEYTMQNIASHADATIIESLIKQMIDADPRKRPTASSILLHPFFWDAKKRLHFLGDCSNRVEKDEDNSSVVRRLEKNGRTIVRNGWREHICDKLKEGKKVAFDNKYF
ncbi:hypothetical protein WR25_10363 isoform B [Diploscapter pachys]|uniref:non-specific serine/threonine protein kinase n=1 Tax=Diploscapter pachys TaxID=2018661 RepID=A0A2A2JHB2_9BILA|nr:hypothetical protein WR25_10363 isoform A [Diploscapter pachys]PAV61046.1 hypothetical protein WR25_10363 isoform B [Diploscapter pachys]